MFIKEKMIMSGATPQSNENKENASTDIMYI